MSISISGNIPLNVVEIGNEITQAKIDEINSGSLATQEYVGLQILDVQTWVTNQGYSTTSGVSADKALANTIASSMWYVHDTGSDWNRVTGITNEKILTGTYGSCGISDGTTFISGFPAVAQADYANPGILGWNNEWKVSVNGTISDFAIMNPTV